MRIIFILFFFVFFFSCNNSKKTQKDKIAEEPELIIKLGFKTNVEDEFVVMLNNIKVDEFQKKNIQVREIVPASSELESIVAKFGEGNKSSNVILSLGKKPKTIFFNGIEFSYGEKSILITSSNFNKFLSTNKFAALENEEFTISTKKLNGKHNPALIAKKRLLDSLFK